VKFTRIGVELFLLACAALFFELAVIRWMSSDLRSIAVLKTFPLVSCFVGLGAGYARPNDKFFRWAPLLMLGFVLMMKTTDFVGLNKLPYPTNSVYQWGIANLGLDLWTYIAVFMVWLAFLLAFPFLTMMALGSRIGRLFNEMKPLRAYSLDIIGSIAGSIIFSVTSYLCAPPWVLMILPAILVAYYGQHLLRAALPALAAVAIAAVPVGEDNHVVWTPYFRLELTPLTAKAADNSDKEIGVLIKVNQMFQQFFFPDLTPEGVTPSKELGATLRIRQRYYNFPYSFKPEPKSVLVLGCGSGQDVMAAVQHGATDIDAVEIDPVVISLGKKLNPTYAQTDVVHLHNTDARNFISKTDKKYDLIVFACLDSLAVTGLGSSVRIDSYVHTKESLARTLSLLKPDGVLVMSFGAGGHHWLRDRLFSTLREAAGYDPLYYTDERSPESWPAFVYVAGESVRNHTLKASNLPEGYESEPLQYSPESRILTDDWPYLYSSPQAFDGPFALLVIEILALSIFVSRKMLFAKDNSPTSWQMAFLGAAFLMLELQAISRLSLIFGATWLTSSLVINGVLVMILMANFFVIKYGDKVNFDIAYASLFISLLISYALPLDTLMSGSLGDLGVALIVFLTLLPMFLAGIVFAASFKRVPDAARALGFNLFGAVMGALLELLSTITGVKALVLIAIGLYAASYWCLKKVSPAPLADTTH
jgi:SAM-dependent methyltransferase